MIPFCRKHNKPVDEVTSFECKEECIYEGDSCPNLDVNGGIR